MKGMMRVSVVITVRNEEQSVGPLLDSLLSQTRKADEIVVVDGGSSDGTIRIIEDYQTANQAIKLLTGRSSRSQGRNIGVKAAKHNIIAMTDADCIASTDWLERIVKPFEEKNVDMVAGFYAMEARSPFQEAASVFLGVNPKKFTGKFLPSTRSIAFRKELWERLGGFPQAHENIAEDTEFNYKAVKAGAGIARRKDAVVKWKLPRRLPEFFAKIFFYAKWDAQSRILWHPGQRLATHTVKIMLVYTRYLVGFGLLLRARNSPSAALMLALGLLTYLLWAFTKVVRDTGNIRSGIWGVLLQFTSDVAVMGGFLSGIIKNVHRQKPEMRT